MGKIEEINETDTVTDKNKNDVINEADKKDSETPRIEDIGDTKETLKVRLCVVFMTIAFVLWKRPYSCCLCFVTCYLCIFFSD